MNMPFKEAPAGEQYQDYIVRLYPEMNKRINYDSESIFPSLNVTFVVTQDCSLRCTYCYQHNKNRDHAMSLDVAKESIDKLFEEYNRGEDGRYIQNYDKQALVIEFIGGEPLLQVDLIDEIIQYFRYKAYVENSPWLIKHRFSVCTNGMNFETPKVQEFIAKYKSALSINISIDGNKELHDACRVTPDGRGSYDIVSKSFKRLIAGDPLADTKLTMAPENIAHLFEAHKNLIEEFNIQNINSNVVYEDVWEDHHPRIMYDEMLKLGHYLIENKYYLTKTLAIFNFHQTGRAEKEDKNWCGGTGAMLAFDTDGSFYPCLRYAPFSMKEGMKPFKIGDIKNGLVMEDEHIETVSFLKTITLTSQSDDKCITCPIATGCGWCSAYNYEVFGTPNKRATFHCGMHQARILANVYYWNTLLSLVDPEGLSERYPMNIPKEWALEIISEKEYNHLIEISR